VKTGGVAGIAALACAVLLVSGGASSAKAECGVIVPFPSQCVTAEAKNGGRGFATLGWFDRGFYLFRACDRGRPDGRRVVAFASFNAGGPGALQNFVQAKHGTGTCGEARRIQPTQLNLHRTVYIRACLRNGARGRIYGCGRTQSLTPR
jgi:hypothetical protein